MTIARVAAALTAPAFAAAFLTVGLATAQAAPGGSASMGSNCVAAQSTPVSTPNTTSALTRAGQLSGASSQSRTTAPVSCIGH